MVLSNYFYKYATEDCGDRVAIPELDRADYMTPQYMEMFAEELESLKLEGKVGVVYSSGASIHQAENRVCSKKEYTNSLSVENSPMVIKSMAAHMMHKYIGLLISNGVEVVASDMVSNTCASSLHGVVLADAMINDGLDHVVVITEDKTSFDTIRIFQEHRIDLKPSDAFALAVFSKDGDGVKVDNCKKAFKYNRNPFLVDAEGYSAVYTKSDVVKGHDTGTAVNSAAEERAFGPGVVGYKSRIGHSQGSSGLLELCMAVDDPELQGKVLCVASGFGGFYGSCIIHK